MWGMIVIFPTPLLFTNLWIKLYLMTKIRCLVYRKKTGRGKEVWLLKKNDNIFSLNLKLTTIGNADLFGCFARLTSE